jgi:hypothetical protein
MSRPSRLPFIAALGAAACLLALPAQAQSPKDKIKQPVTAAGCKPQPGKAYFVEFRARTAASYGHSFVLHGKLGAPGKFAKFEVAGLHPKGYDPAVYMQGHVMPVAAETGASWGDLDEQYLNERYCVVLNEAEYQRTAAYIRKLQATSKEWHAPTNNCNSFIGDIARHMGLLAPPTPILLPEHFVGMIRELNRNATELKSSAGSGAGAGRS